MKKLESTYFRLILAGPIGLMLAAGYPLALGQSNEEPLTSADYYADDQLLAGYIEASLQSHPALQEALARHRAALQKAPQVSTLPDPMLDFTQFARGMDLNMVGLSQTFPWFGKLDLQGQIALKQAAVEYQRYRALEREIIAEVKEPYYEMLYVDRALRITAEEESLLDHYERLAQSRYASGEGLQQAVIKIQTELTRLIDRAKVLNLQRESLIAQLNTLMDRPPESPVSVADSGELPDVSLNLEELYDLGEVNRHELKASLAQIEKNERSVQLEKKNYWPDFRVGVGFKNARDREEDDGIGMPASGGGTNALSFSVGINIPIWRDKYRAGEVEAAENLIASRKGYESIRNNVELSIRDQVLRLQTLKEQIGLYDEVLIPQAEESLRSTESAYETGQIGALELLDSERLLLASRLMNERYRIDYLQALAQLEFAVGTRFPR